MEFRRVLFRSRPKTSLATAGWHTHCGSAREVFGRRPCGAACVAICQLRREHRHGRKGTMMEEKDWESLAAVCDLTMPELPLDKSPEEQLAFLREYLARVRQSTRYDCYTYVERKVADLEAAASSPFMDA